MHFIAGGLLVIVVFVLQYLPVTMHVGDALRWAFCIFPTFVVTHGILFSASGSLLVGSRSVDETEEGVIIPRKIPAGIWDWYNLKGDCVILIVHFFLGILILALIELEVWPMISDAVFPKIACRSCREQNRAGPPLIMDDDVLAEEKRIALQGTERPDDDPSVE